MKNTKLALSTVFAGALLFGASGTFAHEGEKHSTDSTTQAGKPMSSHDGMTALYAHLHEIEEQLAAGKLDGMHEHAEAIEAATKDLDKDTTLDATKKKRVQGYVKNVAKLADKMHDAADAKKLDETKKEFKKLQAQVDLLDKQFSHSHKPKAEGEHSDDAHPHEAGK